MTLRNRSRTLLALLVAFLVSLLAAVRSEAVLIRHDRKLDQYRQRGAESQFQSVGRDYIKGKLSASGVLVAPKWVLTCAHVASIEPLEDHKWEFDGKPYRATNVVLHPSFEQDRGSTAKTTAELRELYWNHKVAVLANGWDLALVELDSPVEKVKPASRYQGNKEVGRIATMVGYGVRGDGRKGPESPRVQERLGGDNVIDAAGRAVGEIELTDRVLVMDFDHVDDEKLNWCGDAKPLDLEAGAAAGDSGGGLFVKDAEDWFLAGIHQASPPRTGKRDEPGPRIYGQVMLFVRVATWNEWIDEVIADSANNPRRSEGR